MALTVAQLVARLTADTSGFYKSMAIANSSMLRTGSIVSRVAAGAGLAVAGMGILSLRAAGNFQQSMNILGAVSEATTKQMDDMRKEAIDLGADIKLPNVSAKDAAESMTNLAKAGLSVKDIMGATRGTLQLGIAANVSFADSANVVARALTAFHLNGTQAVKVADLFTAAANKSTADISDIALGFQAASAQFQAGDQSIEGLTTSLTLMANAGIVGSDAGTSLKTMMNRLMAPTKKAKELMSDLGISIYNQAGNMRPMPQLINQFNKGMKGMTKEQKNAALYTVFGSDAIRAARVQMNAGTEGWNKMEASITKGGEAQKFANAQTAGFNGALGAFTSTIETLAIQLGTALLPAATQVVRAMTNFIGSIDPDKIIGFFGAIADTVKWVYKLIDGSVILQGIIGGVIAAFVAYKTIMMIATAVTEGYAAVMAILDAVMIANPIVLVIAALVGLAAALIIAYKRSEEFRNIVNGVFDFLKGAVTATVNFVRNNWELLVGALGGPVGIAAALIYKHWDQIEAFISNTIRSILGFLRSTWSTIVSTITGALSSIEHAVVSAWTTVRNAITTAVNAVVSFVRSNWALLIGIVTGPLGIIVGLVVSHWNQIVSATRTAFNAVKQAITDALMSIPGAIVSAAMAVVGAAHALGQAIINGIVGGLGGLFGAVAGAVKNQVKGAISWVGGHLGSTAEEYAGEQIGMPIAQGIIKSFLLGTADLPSKMSQRLRDALTKAKDQVQAAQGIMNTAFQALGSQAIKAFEGATSAQLTKMQSAFDAKVRRLVTNPLNAVLKQLEKDNNAALAALDKQQNAPTDTEKKLTALQAGHDEEERQQAIKDARAKFDAAMAADSDATDADKLSAQKDLADALYSEQIFTLQKQADAERTAKDASIALQKDEINQKYANDQDAVKAAYDSLQTALQAQYDTQVLNYQSQRDLQEAHLQATVDALGASLATHPGMWQSAHDTIMKLFRESFGPAYKKAGRNLGTGFAKGLEESFSAVQKAAESMARILENNLKVKSPTKEGPMSDLDNWWSAFGTTLVGGLDVSPVRSAADALAGMVGPVTGTLSSVPVSAPAATGMYAGGTVIQVNNPQFMTANRMEMREFADKLREFLP